MSHHEEWRKHATEQLGSGPANRLGSGQTSGSDYRGTGGQNQGTSYRSGLSKLAELYTKRPAVINIDGVNYRLQGMGHDGTVTQDYVIATPVRPVLGKIRSNELKYGSEDVSMLTVGVAFLDRTPTEEVKFNLKRIVSKNVTKTNYVILDGDCMFHQFTKDGIASSLLWEANIELDHFYKQPDKPPEYREEVIRKGWHGIGRKTKRIRVEHPEVTRNYPEVVGTDVYFYVATRDEPRIGSGRPAPGIKVTSPGSGIMVITPADLATQ